MSFPSLHVPYYNSTETLSFHFLGAHSFEHLIEGLSHLLQSYQLFEKETFFISSLPPQRETLTTGRRILSSDLKALKNEEFYILIPDERGVPENNEMMPSAYLRINKKANELEFINFLERHTNFLDHLKNILHNEPFYLTPQENKQLETFNTTYKNLPEPHTVDQLFDKVCHLYPHHTAVITSNDHISYQDLYELSQKISSYLKNKLDSLPGEKIALGLSKSINLIAGLFGILRMGNSYVPLSSTYPSDRVSDILGEAQASIILCDKNFFEQHKNILKDLKVIMVEDITASSPLPLVVSSTHPDDLAYVIFTSGSTSKPKGVMINHRGIVNLAHVAKDICLLKPEDRVLCIAHMGFDASAWDIFATLLNGATLYFPKDGLHTKIEDLTSFLLKHKINMGTLTPGILSQLPDQSLFKSLTTLIVVGERCQKKVMDEWSQGRRLMNGYGPTEATIGTSLSIYTPNTSATCIGRPFYNCQIHILDAQRRPVGIDFIGEIWITGMGVARGYLNNKPLEVKNFDDIQLPYMNGPLKAFRTGDLGRWTKKGDVEFVGREQDQIKIKDITIKPDEIENSINQHPHIKRSFVTLVKKENRQQLLGYIIPEVNENLSELVSSLKKHLNKSLPPLMLPDEIIAITHFPLTYNGKISRNLLPKPDHTD